MVPTRYMDDDVLDTLGFRDDFDWLLPRVGWGTFMTVRDLICAELTLEFLGSLKEEILQGPHCVAGRITFRLRDTDFTLTLTDFNVILCLMVGGELRPLREFEA
ncbi:hypothetical protein Lal_00033933 [Lupinus albus]|nr:hypothetical protein Lal_00033933 [Lupinus albus]